MSVDGFLNVDLDLRDRRGVGAVVRALGPKMVVMNHERKDFASLELPLLPNQKLVPTLRRWLRVIEALSPAGKKAWRACRSKELSIGIEAVPNRQLVHVVPLELQKRINALGLEIQIVVYPPDVPGE